MSYEYSFEFYPDALFQEALAGEKRRVFACKAERECRVEDTHPEFNQLVEIFSARGKQGFELAQIFFQDQGVLVLYKKMLNDEVREAGG